MTPSALETGTAQKVLIVEDEGEMCLVLNILLNDEHVELEHVKTVAEAAVSLESNTPALVILDNKLPDGYGVDFISYIKKSYPSIRIIMITGYDGAVKDVALENGADYFLEKPFTRQQLLDAVKGLLSVPA